MHRVGKYAIPIGTAALSGGALGYLAYKLSPKRYKKLMGTLGAVVGAAAGAYGGYKLSSSLGSPNQISEQPKTSKAKIDKPSVVEKPAEGDTPGDNKLAEQAYVDLAKDIGKDLASQKRVEEIRSNAASKYLNLHTVPFVEGSLDALGNATPELSQLNPRYWMYTGIGSGADALIPEGLDGLGGQALKAGARAGGIALSEYGARNLTKIPGAVGSTAARIGSGITTAGTALDRIKAGVDTINNVRKGLNDSSNLQRAEQRTAEIEGHLGEHASPSEAAMYSFARNLAEKGIRTTLFGFSAKGTGGITSALGVNLGLPLEDVAAVGKEVSRHFGDNTERQRSENKTTLSEWWRSVGSKDLGTSWLKALGGGHGSSKSESSRVAEENKVSARPVDTKATQKYISQLYAAVDREFPGISMKERNRKVAEKLKTYEPVRHTNKQLQDRLLRENPQSLQTLYNISKAQGIPLKTLLNRAAKAKYGFEIW